MACALDIKAAVWGGDGVVVDCAPRAHGSCCKRHYPSGTPGSGPWSAPPCSLVLRRQ
uniref:Uncharacterized protein n=1 Tax=Arundo donax TaxID=35708 RepID=A0A0A8ZME9_ARUDO